MEATPPSQLAVETPISGWSNRRSLFFGVISEDY
jgi:hypothetical protein